VDSTLVSSGAEEGTPALSPDGRWLAYSADQSGNPATTENMLRRADLFVRPFPDVEGVRWQVSTSGGRDPVWSADGRELYYHDLERGVPVAAAIETTPTFRVTSREVLFDVSPYYMRTDGGTYDVTRDGRFLMIRRATREGGIDRVILVENFLEEVRERLSGG
jgi:serine/threonine-protein kinase